MENTFNITLSNGEVQAFSRADMVLIYNAYRFLTRKEYIEENWSGVDAEVVAAQSILYEDKYFMSEDTAIEEAIAKEDN